MGILLKMIKDNKDDGSSKEKVKDSLHSDIAKI